MTGTDPSVDPLEQTAQRLRGALVSRARAVDARVLGSDPGVVVPIERRARRNRALWLAPAGAVAAIVMLVAVAMLVTDGGSNPQVTTGAGSTIDTMGTSSTSTPPESTISAAPTTLAQVPPLTKPPKSTTSTMPVDRTIVGWPGQGSTRYPTARSAATAFADTVLGFAQSSFVRQTSEDVPVGGTAQVTIKSRPTAGATTTITAARNGSRSWVVRGATSSQGTITRSTFGPDRIDVAGTASAFEATVTIRALSLGATKLGEDITMAGSTGKLPYEGSVSYRGGPAAFVLTGESDASGEGDLVWACVVLDPALG